MRQDLLALQIQNARLQDASEASSQDRMQFEVRDTMVPPGTLVLDPWLSALCMRSKAWLAARVERRRRER